MAARLATLAEQPASDAQENGPERARAQGFSALDAGLTSDLRDQIASNDDPFLDLGLRHRLAIQLLREGLSEESLEELEELGARLERLQIPPPPERRSSLVAKLMISTGVAALRLGEQENCIAHHSSESCLVPIRGEGVHHVQRGSRKAIEAFTRALEIDPTALDARWLLNLAYMTVGEYPDGVPHRFLVEPERFDSEYEVGRFRDVGIVSGANLVGLAGGGVIEDFDLDGLPDIVASSWGLTDQLRYLRNTGSGQFEDRTVQAGLEGLVGGINLNHADFDNDGYPDLLVLRGGWLGEDGRHPNSLLRNRGDGTFDDVTEAAGLLAFHGSHSAAWGDFDNDGWLDLFVGNEEWNPAHPHPSQLFRNQGDGTFEEVAAESGIGTLGPVKGVVWGDYDNDGWLDLYISIFGRPNRLLRNVAASGDKRTFVDVTREAGVAEPLFSFATWFWDYDNDGWQDLFVAAWDGAPLTTVVSHWLDVSGGAHAEVPRLYRNNRDGTFSNVTAEVGLDRTLLVMGANFGDLDNDGFLDLYLGTGAPDLATLMPNRMFRNAAGLRFQDVTTSGGFGHVQKGHGIAFGDIDGDGDQDVLAVMGGWYSGDAYMNALFENPGHGNRWLTVRLRGNRSNRFGVGARLRLVVRSDEGVREIYATVSTGGSFGSSTLQQELGLGRATGIELLEVTWPASGEVQHFTEVPMDRIVLVTEGDPVLEELPARRFSFLGTGQP